MNRIVLHTDTDWVAGRREFEPPTDETWNWFKHPPETGEVHIFEDNNLPKHVNYKNVIKIASLLEAPIIYDHASKYGSGVFHPYRWIEENYQHFDYVMSPFTYLERLFPDKFLWVPAASSRIFRNQIGLYEKERNLSVIASFKTWTEGHKLRHDFINRYTGKVDFDIYGSGYNTVIDSEENGRLLSLAPYRFNICIVNCIADDFFTEHVTDVFAVGTIPVIRVTKNLGKYFNKDGFIEFTHLDELDEILPTLTPELYNSKLDAVKENVELSKKYMNIPDYIYENYKEKLESL